MVDFHTHTNESDGTLSPVQLLEEAARAGLQRLAITDHDTFTGYEAAVTANSFGIELVQGIEISTRDQGRSIHLLSYFPESRPSAEFLAWLSAFAARRKDRNRRLAARLNELGLSMELDEVYALGRTVTGRVHFARAMVARGYVRTVQQAFREYLGEGAPAYVEIDDPDLTDAIARVRQTGGLPVVAHLGRYGFDEAREHRFVARATEAGLAGLEVVHTDHSLEMTKRYADLAAHFQLLPTGGSDYHGAVTPHARLGHGDSGTMPIPRQWGDALCRD